MVDIAKASPQDNDTGAAFRKEMQLALAGQRVDKFAKRKTLNPRAREELLNEQRERKFHHSYKTERCNTTRI
jgi:hypothetical protein